MKSKKKLLQDRLASNNKNKLFNNNLIINNNKNSGKNRLEKNINDLTRQEQSLKQLHKSITDKLNLRDNNQLNANFLNTTIGSSTPFPIGSPAIIPIKGLKIPISKNVFDNSGVGLNQIANRIDTIQTMGALGMRRSSLPNLNTNGMLGAQFGNMTNAGVNNLNTTSININNTNTINGLDNSGNRINNEMTNKISNTNTNSNINSNNNANLINNQNNSNNNTNTPTNTITNINTIQTLPLTNVNNSGINNRKESNDDINNKSKNLSKEVDEFFGNDDDDQENDEIKDSDLDTDDSFIHLREKIVTNKRIHNNDNNLIYNHINNNDEIRDEYDDDNEDKEFHVKSTEDIKHSVQELLKDNKITNEDQPNSISHIKKINNYQKEIEHSFSNERNNFETDINYNKNGNIKNNHFQFNNSYLRGDKRRNRNKIERNTSLSNYNNSINEGADNNRTVTKSKI